MYVGYSSNIQARIGNHAANKDMDFDSYVYLVQPDEQTARRMEYRYIRQYKPSYNIVGTPYNGRRRAKTVSG